MHLLHFLDLKSEGLSLCELQMEVALSEANLSLADCSTMEVNF